jgi:hypothetical protein
MSISKIMRYRYHSGMTLDLTEHETASDEHDLIRTRTAEGRSRAKDRGKRKGRPPSLTPAQQKEAI